MKQSYTPIRDISARVALGMNSPSDSRRFGRMRDAFRNDAAYWGERGEWFIVAAQNRDSDALDRSNFAVLLKRLGGEGETVVIERANHWACGWVEYLIVAPADHKALRTAIQAHTSYCEYPALDESHLSGVEDEECCETWVNCFDRKERAEYLRKHLHTVSGFSSLRAAVNGDWYEAANLLPCPSDLIH